jgi:hypothetical protein
LDEKVIFHRQNTKRLLWISEHLSVPSRLRIAVLRFGRGMPFGCRQTAMSDCVIDTSPRG